MIADLGDGFVDCAQSLLVLVLGRQPDGTAAALDWLEGDTAPPPE